MKNRAKDEDLSNVDVKGFSGLVVDFARDNGVTVLVRGVRTVGITAK